jgi:hypothetical protein
MVHGYFPAGTNVPCLEVTIFSEGNVSPMVFSSSILGSRVI